jgi:putative mRNA 3-end processing factor
VSKVPSHQSVSGKLWRADGAVSTAVFETWDFVKRSHSVYLHFLERFRLRGIRRVFVDLIDDGLTFGVAASFVLLAYALGKAQRLAAMLDPTIGPIVGHGAVMKMVRAYRDSGVRLPPIDAVPPRARRVGDGRALVIAPPSVAGSRWLRLFGEVSVAPASGWMTVRGIRRRRGCERGFVVSDHADFPGLLSAIEASRARRVLVTHGASDSLARLLRERGFDAAPLATQFTGEPPPDDGGPEDDAADDAVAEELA